MVIFFFKLTPDTSFGKPPAKNHLTNEKFMSPHPKKIETQTHPPITTAEQVQAGASKSESLERNSKFRRENPPTNHQEDLQTLGPYSDLQVLFQHLSIQLCFLHLL